MQPPQMTSPQHSLYWDSLQFIGRGYAQSTHSSSGGSCIDSGSVGSAAATAAAASVSISAGVAVIVDRGVHAGAGGAVFVFVVLVGSVVVASLLRNTRLYFETGNSCSRRRSRGLTAQEVFSFSQEK